MSRKKQDEAPPPPLSGVLRECAKCGHTKPIEAYARNPLTKKRHTWCRVCMGDRLSPSWQKHFEDAVRGRLCS